MSEAFVPVEADDSTGQELSDEDLSFVVGGLRRAWDGLAEDEGATTPR